MYNYSSKPGILGNPSNRMHHLVSFVTFKDGVTHMNARAFFACSPFGGKETACIYLIETPFKKLMAMGLFQIDCLSVICNADGIKVSTFSKRILDRYIQVAIAIADIAAEILV